MSAPVHYHYDQFPPQELDWKVLAPLIGSTIERSRGKGGALVAHLLHLNPIVAHFLSKMSHKCGGPCSGWRLVVSD